MIGCEILQKSPRAGGGAATVRSTGDSVCSGRGHAICSGCLLGQEETKPGERQEAAPVDSEWPNALQSPCRAVWLSG